MSAPTFDLAAVFAKNRALFGDTRMEGEGTTPPATGGDAGGDDAGTDQLGDAGKQALDRMKAERNAARAEAKANADAAAKLKKIEEANQTEAEKVAARLAEADTKVAGIPALVSEALKSHLVALHEINDEDAELFLTATDPELLLKQVARLTGNGTGKKTGNRVTREGRQTTGPENEERTAVRGLFGSD